MASRDGSDRTRNGISQLAARYAPSVGVSMFWSTNRSTTWAKRRRDGSGFWMGSYPEGERTRPARKAPSMVVRSSTLLPKYTSAAACRP